MGIYILISFVSKVLDLTQLEKAKQEPETNKKPRNGQVYSKAETLEELEQLASGEGGIRKHDCNNEKIKRR